MVGLHLIKHMDGLSDAAVCARFLDSPSVPLFCGESHFQHALPLDRSSMTRWRQRIGAERLELLLAETLAATNRPVPGGKVVLGARTLPGNPCDGHTLAAQIAQTERITGVTIERARVDRGDRGHDADDRRSGEAHQSRVFLSGQRRGVTPTIRREIRRRAGIEPAIGQMKADGHLGRNFLAGAAGDAITLILAAAGHTLRLLRAWLIRLLAFLLSLLAVSATAPPLPSPQLAARLHHVLEGRLTSSMQKDRPGERATSDTTPASPTAGLAPCRTCTQLPQGSESGRGDLVNGRIGGVAGFLAHPVANGHGGVLGGGSERTHAMLGLQRRDDFDRLPKGRSTPPPFLARRG
jgi:IS5 family transposase